MRRHGFSSRTDGSPPDESKHAAHAHDGHDQHAGLVHHGACRLPQRVARHRWPPSRVAPGRGYRTPATKRRSRGRSLGFGPWPTSTVGSPCRWRRLRGARAIHPPVQPSPRSFTENGPALPIARGTRSGAACVDTRLRLRQATSLVLLRSRATGSARPRAGVRCGPRIRDPGPHPGVVPE